MSASMVKCCQRLVSPFLLPSHGLPLVQVRTAKKAARGSTRNEVRRCRRKNRGIRVQDGCFVHAGQVLVKQTSLRFYPGENVDITRLHTLTAMCDGKVVVSCETLKPHEDSPLYDAVQKGLVIHKKFFNVYPSPMHSKFRLVSQI